MTRGFQIAALALGLSATQPATAQEAGPVVVELFSSQGCSSCPPADALLGELAGRDGIIALALHVDYWDYIGWSDTFATPEFTARQHGYGRAAGSRVVYTPQMVIGGQDHVVGYRPMEVADLIAAHRDAPDPVAITVSEAEAGRRVRAEWRAEPPAPPMLVQLVAYRPEETVEIARGENAGRVADYHNIVTDWQVVAEWDGGAPIELSVTGGGDTPRVVIIQAEGFGAILGAARLN